LLHCQTSVGKIATLIFPSGADADQLTPKGPLHGRCESTTPPRPVQPAGSIAYIAGPRLITPGSGMTARCKIIAPGGSGFFNASGCDATAAGVEFAGGAMTLASDFSQAASIAAAASNPKFFINGPAFEDLT
jgi:hypothetical protein